MDEGGRNREQVGEEQYLGEGVESSRIRRAWRVTKAGERERRVLGEGLRAQHLKRVWVERALLNASAYMLDSRVSIKE